MAAPAAAVNTTMLSSAAVQAITEYVRDVESGLGGGVRWYVQNAMDETLTSVTGPGINKRDLSTTVVVPLSKIAVGRQPNDLQCANKAAMKTLISKTFEPASLPQDRVEFVISYEVTEQRLARKGNGHTIAGGSATKRIDLRVSLDEAVVSITMDDSELNIKTDPEVVARAMQKELECAATAWDLTCVMDHANYCARQPLFCEQILLRKEAMKGNGINEGTVLRAVQLETILTGCLNRDPSNIFPLMHGAMKAIKGVPGKVVAVTTQTAFSACNSTGKVATVQLDTKVNVSKYALTKHGSFGLGGGHVHKTLGSAHIFQIQGSGPEPYGNKGSASVFRHTTTDQAQGVRIPALPLGDDSYVPTVVLDNVAFNQSGTGAPSLESALVQNGLKRTFFTVGCCPPTYKRLANLGFYESGPDTDKSQAGPSPKMVAARNPGYTYIVDHDKGDRCVEIALKDLHRHYVQNHPTLFDLEVFANKCRSLGGNMLAIFTEQSVAALFKMDSWQEKLGREICCFEFDPRFMLIVENGDNNQEGGVVVMSCTETGEGAPEERRVVAIPRTCFYNTSPMSMRENELVGVLSSLRQHAALNKDIERYMNMVANALEDNSAGGAADLLAMRGNDLAEGDTGLPDDTLAQNLFLRGTCYLPLSDPYCQLLILKHLDRVVAGGGQGIVEILPVLKEIQEMLRRGIVAIKNVFLRVFGNNPAYCLFAESQMDNTVVNTRRGTAEENQFLNLAYMCVMPVVSDTLYVVDEAPTDDIHVPNNMAIISIEQAFFVPRGYERPGGATERLWARDTVAINLVREIWKTRSAEIATMFGQGECRTMGFLAHLHYSTLLSEETMLNHLDRNYYSGLAYMCVRTWRWNGHGLAFMHLGGAKYITGNMGVTEPIRESMGRSVVTQVFESAIAPDGLESMGVYIPNVFCTDIQGAGSQFHQDSKDAIAILDIYNGFIPGSHNITTDVPPVVPISGRYDNCECLYMPDNITGLYTECPTLCHYLSSGLDKINHVKASMPHNHSYQLLARCLGRGLVDAVPPLFRDERYLTPEEVIKRCLECTVEERNLLTDANCLLYADNYSVGRGTEYVLKHSSNAMSMDDAALCPKIMGESLFNSALYGERDECFSLKFEHLAGTNIKT